MMAECLLVATLFTLHLLVGFAEAPAFPGNSRFRRCLVPRERATAAAIAEAEMRSNS
jgi:hypothetical protein